MSSKSVPPVAHCEVSELHTVAQKEAAKKKPPAYLKSMECCLVYLFCLPPKIILRPVLSQLSINFTSKSYFYLILIQVMDSVKSITCKIFLQKRGCRTSKCFLLGGSPALCPNGIEIGHVFDAILYKRSSFPGIPFGMPYFRLFCFQLSKSMPFLMEKDNFPFFRSESCNEAY